MNEELGQQDNQWFLEFLDSITNTKIQSEAKTIKTK